MSKLEALVEKNILFYALSAEIKALKDEVKLEIAKVKSRFVMDTISFTPRVAKEKSLITSRIFWIYKILPRYHNRKSTKYWKKTSVL